MAFVLSDRVKETTTTTGTGDLSLGGAVTGFKTFSSRMADGDTTYYSITDGTEWEVGIGTYESTGTLLIRSTVLKSSNSDAAVNFSAGTKTVFMTIPGDKVGTIDTAQTFSNKSMSGSANTFTNIPSTALLEAFLKGRFQANTTNSQASGLTIQAGWGFVPGDGDSIATEAVTFPVTFSAAPLMILASALGAKSGSDPSNISDFTADAIFASANAPSASGFTLVVYRASGTMASSVRAGYSWIAIGAV